MTPKRRRVSHRDPSVASPSKKRRERARRTRLAMWERTRWSRHVDGLLADILAEGPAGSVILQGSAQPGEGDRLFDDSSSRIGGPLADDAEGIPAMAGGLPTTAEEEQGEEEDIEDDVLLEDVGTEVAKYMEGETQLEPAFVEAGAALEDIRGRLVAARLTNGWHFLAGAARVEAMEYSKKAVWALECSVENLLRIWSVGEDDEERAAASRQIAMTLDDHMDEKEEGARGGRGGQRGDRGSAARHGDHIGNHAVEPRNLFGGHG